MVCTSTASIKPYTQDSFVREIYLAEAFVHVHLYVTWEEAIWSHLQQANKLVCKTFYLVCPPWCWCAYQCWSGK
jgi:hypothetical protein